MRSADLRPRGIPREYLSKLHRDGVLERVSRGVYYLPGTELTEHHSLTEAIKIAPRGIICLLSALQFHGLTSQAPFEVWLTLDRKAHRPAGDGVPLHVVRFSGLALTAGVEEYLIEGVKVPVYSPAKTVADYRWAVKDPVLGRHIKTNPALLARPKRPHPYQTGSTKSLTDEEMNRLLAAVKSKADAGSVVAKRDYALLLLYFLTGLRRNELISLRGTDVELKEEGLILKYRRKGGKYGAREVLDAAAV